MNSKLNDSWLNTWHPQPQKHMPQAIHYDKQTNQPCFTRWFFWVELFLVRTRFLATDDFLTVGTVSQSSSVRSITPTSLTTGPLFSLAAGWKSVGDKQPLIAGGLTVGGGEGEWLGVDVRDSGRGPRKNFSNVTEDKSYLLIISSCHTATVRIQWGK